jgi:hypothetical protein
MASVIILENGATTGQVGHTITTMRGAGAEDLIVIGNTKPQRTVENAGSQGSVSNILLSSAISISSCLRQAALIAKNDGLIFVDARLPITAEQAASIMMGSKNTSSIAFAPLLQDEERIDLGVGDASAIVDMVSNRSLWPVALVRASRAAITELGEVNAQSSGECLAMMLIQSIGCGNAIEEFDLAISMNGMADDVAALNTQARARCLRHAIQSCNIEEMFPQMSWNGADTNPGATCYHTLAALFIRLGDTTSAMECLALSDRLLDSPRSLALKGLIASARGEVLGAVANMVSSLQQYETMQGENQDTSSLRSKMEVINQTLKEGLDALNRRDNERALQHFTSAVFSFDPFYEQLGISAESEPHN